MLVCKDALLIENCSPVAGSSHLSGKSVFISYFQALDQSLTRILRVMFSIFENNVFCVCEYLIR